MSYRVIGTRGGFDEGDGSAGAAATGSAQDIGGALDPNGGRLDAGIEIDPNGALDIGVRIDPDGLHAAWLADFLV